MNPTAAPSDTAPVTRTLKRPTTVRRRVWGRVERLRTAWKRVTVAIASGLAAAALTVAWLSTPSTPSSDAGADGPVADPESSAGIDPDRASTATTPGESLADGQRILALDRSTIALPVAAGSIVELVGFRPGVTDVDIEVITPEAEVVGVTDDAVLLAVDAEAAYTAGEIAAVGRVAVLGRQRPKQ